RFEFSKISEEDIKSRIIHVLNEENVKYEEEAVEYIAKLADGALRDALSILDRCLSEKEEILRLAKVEEIIGATSKEILDRLVDSILNRDNLAVISAIDEVVLKGKDLRQLVYSLTERFLELLVKSNSKEYIDKIANIIDELSSLDNEIRLSSKPTILIKSALVRISNLGNKKITQTLVEESVNNIDSDPRIEKLENEVNKLTNIINTMKKDKEIDNRVVSSINYESKTVNEEKNINNENMKPFKDYEKFKNTILSKGKIKAYSTLAGSNMYLTDENAIIITKNEYSYKIISADEQKETIAQMLNEEYGINKPLIIKLKKQANETKFEKLLKDSNTEYTKLD
ncbi:MAG: hypothetical protein PHR25_06785, partial [Clostridia bacterium]|nr:hypothetical protein [Clostridia bacterium]